MTDDTLMPYFPVFMDLRGRKVLLVGGTEAAASKARLLTRAGAAVTVVADTLCEDLAAMVREDRVTWERRPFTADMVNGARLVIDGAGDAGLTDAVQAAAEARNVPLNVVDVPERCDFTVPAMLDRAPVMVAISTGGGAPALARTLRQRLETAIPAGTGRLAAAAEACRRRVKDALPTTRARQRFWDSVLTGEVADTLMGLTEAEATARIETELERFAAAGTADTGSVTLVGAGPGDPGLLTVNAVKTIGTADVILHDALVPESILSLARRETRLVPVGKRAGRPSVPQGFTNRMMATCARRGLRVVRLKGGDPFIFGRGGEEAAFLREAGIAVRIVPGITTAVAAAADLGLPLTHRGVARSLRLATASCRTPQETAAVDWRAMADPTTTLAVYMGRDQIVGIARSLIAAGLPAATPAVMAASVCRPDAARVWAPLSDLADRVMERPLDTAAPALLLIGNAVAEAPGWPAQSRLDSAAAL
ncbi:Siroheme synthase [Caenispirillum salinarum AK4]|uniref:Siroheme synthase n=1 Tax=Caenispirillum salinarum AK4 TaxID=1238182 RepID=K9HEN2_9PROT|nr:siroheme synthase CysG [Caenispirillum salinarum]EKV28968.1 Siroheme synthase [Caenispirillum salinarum AK4]